MMVYGMLNNILDDLYNLYVYYSQVECIFLFFVSPNKHHPAPPRRFQHCYMLFIVVACVCVSIECSVISSVGVCVFPFKMFVLSR